MKQFLLFVGILACSCAAKTVHPEAKPAQTSSPALHFLDEKSSFFAFRNYKASAEESKFLPMRIACIPDEQGRAKGVYFTWALSFGETKENLGAYKDTAVFLGQGTHAAADEQGNITCDGQILSANQIVNSWQDPLPSNILFPLGKPPTK